MCLVLLSNALLKVKMLQKVSIRIFLTKKKLINFSTNQVKIRRKKFCEGKHTLKKLSHFSNLTKNY